MSDLLAQSSQQSSYKAVVPNGGRYRPLGVISENQGGREEEGDGYGSFRITVQGAFWYLQMGRSYPKRRRCTEKGWEPLIWSGNIMSLFPLFFTYLWQMYKAEMKLGMTKLMGFGKETKEYLFREILSIPLVGALFSHSEEDYWAERLFLTRTRAVPWSWDIRT